MIESQTAFMARQEAELQRHQISESGMIVQQSSQLAVLGNLMVTQESNCWRILDHTQNTANILHEIKEMVQLTAAYLQHRDSTPMFFTGPDPTFGKPVYFEDSLGNQLQFSAELFPSWEASSRFLPAYAGRETI